MGRPIQTVADLRAERHARTFTAQQVTLDPHVARLAAQGYNAHQIAMLARVPLIDVRLMLAVIEQASRSAGRSEQRSASQTKPKRQREADPNA
jgi:hypothetical protein